MLTSKQENLYTEVTLCGKLISKELFDSRKSGKLYRLELELNKGAHRNINKGEPIIIPVIMDNITVLNPASAINSNDRLNIEPLGSHEKLVLGERYFIKARLGKVSVFLEDGEVRRITHIIVKSICVAPTGMEDINSIQGEYLLEEKPVVTVVGNQIYSTLRLSGKEIYKPKIVANTRSKIALYSRILNVNDEIKLKGSLYHTTYFLKTKDGQRISCDTFSIYVRRMVSNR